MRPFKSSTKQALLTPHMWHALLISASKFERSCSNKPSFTQGAGADGALNSANASQNKPGRRFFGNTSTSKTCNLACNSSRPERSKSICQQSAAYTETCLLETGGVIMQHKPFAILCLHTYPENIEKYYKQVHLVWQA